MTRLGLKRAGFAALLGAYLIFPLARADGAWTSLRLAPEKIALQGPGASQAFIVTAALADGFEEDVTAQARLTSSDPAIVSVDHPNRRLMSESPGKAHLKVAVGDLSQEIVVTVGERTGAMEVNFSRDVLSILTTKGCNGSACHGSPAGQNGFKLSLYGSDVTADHRMIIQEHDGRRVRLDAPQDSLVLKKPTFQVAHGGGHLMTAESDEYKTILNWLKQGAALDSDGPRLTKLEIYPRKGILVGKGSTQPFVALGRLTDGTTRDMSQEVRYSVVDTGVVSSVEDGVVRSKSRGLTTVMAHAMGKVATSQLIVIDERATSEYPPLTGNNFIDRHVFDKLRQVNIVPYPLSSDRVFVRRVFLDAIGELPTPEEVDAFVADTRSDKRSRLIDDLLERPGYAKHWLVKFEDWFRNSQYYSQGRTNGSYKHWIYEKIRLDQPYDQWVYEMLTAKGDTTVRPAGNFWHPAIDFMLKTFEVSKITPTVSRLFLGKRIECAECHNHPLENLSQDDFYGMAAFFARLKVKHGYGEYRRIWYTERQGEVMHPVSGKPVAPKFLEGEAPDIPPGVDRRQVLAEWVVGHPQFARATVNRIWAQYFGRGIVDPHDDFRSTNMPTHPELLEQLARYFADSGFRFKPLHRLILNSRAYQLSAHEPNRVGRSDPLERMLFARYEPSKLSAEVLLDAIVQVTGIAHEFRDYPEGTSPKEVIASNGADYFLTTFGFPRRDVLSDRVETPSLSQALHLMNSKGIRDKVEAEDNVLGRLLDHGRDDQAIVSEIYVRAYARPPTEKQWRTLRDFMASEQAAGRSRRRALENVLWAVLNSKQFQLNR